MVSNVKIEISDENKRSPLNLVCCRACEKDLMSDNNIVDAAIDYDTFLNSTVDSFWVGYQPLHNTRSFDLRKNTNTNRLFIGPVPWIQASITKSAENSIDSKKRRTSTKRIQKALHQSMEQKKISWSRKNKGQDGSSTYDVESSHDALLHCPHCSHCCGYYDRNALAICAGFILVPLIVLLSSEIILVPVVHEETDDTPLDTRIDETTEIV
jgi:hypothetical protein